MSVAQQLAPGPGRDQGLLGRIGKSFRDLARDPNPILVKELRATFRTNLFIRFLYLSTAVIAVVVLSGGAVAASSSLPPAEVGQIVFQIFFSTALMVISLVAPAYAATTLTSEKEQKTYESLLLSGMAPWRIVRGKFIASYAAMFLVLIAQVPVVGTVFLFGGISPWQVLIGYVSLLLCLAPAIGFGVAISARLSSTRIAILVATLVFVPAAFFLTLIVVGLGEAARSPWGVGMQGPFWFAEALANRFTELDTFGFLVLLPGFVFGMAVWFLLASAVAGVRPAAEDRSTPFKIWSLVAAAGVVLTAAGMTLPINSADVGEAGVAIVSMASSSAFAFFALLFANEPPLPPRLAEERPRGLLSRIVFRAIGPGAAPTLRFTIGLILITAIALALCVSVTRHLAHGGAQTRYDVALMVAVVGHAAVGLFLAALGSWLRLVLRNGIAARVLVVAVMLALTFIPYLLALVIDSRALDRMNHEVPLVILLGPSAPSLISWNIADAGMGMSDALLVAVPTIIYGLGAALFWVLTEALVRRSRQYDEKRRARQKARARDSRPSVPLLQRTSALPQASSVAVPEAGQPAKEPDSGSDASGPDGGDVSGGEGGGGTRQADGRRDAIDPETTS